MSSTTHRRRPLLGLSLLAHAALSSAQSTTPSSSSSTGTQAQQSQQAQWVLPIAGLSDDPSAPWGVNVSAVSSDGQSNPNSITLQRVSFSPNGSAPSASSAQSIYSSANNYGPDAQQNQMWLPAAGDALALGPNSNLTVSTPTSSSDTAIALVNSTFPALPFGLALGRAGAWQGSLTFGGAYDANRLADTAWHRLPSAPDLLSGGRHEFDGSNLSVGHPPQGTQQTVVLDFNSEAVVLTAGAATGSHCGQSLMVSVGGASWSIGSSLLQAPNRCTENDPAVRNGTVVLGKPFFQASYLYADADQGLYVAKAGNMSLAPNPTPFAASQVVHSEPSPPPAPSPSAKSAAGNGRLGLAMKAEEVSCLGVLFAASVVGFGLF